ncbi:MAG TPA: imidazoleglycerol-phosphate dehydratase HisB [Clostridia bacterium]|nr:imidazoleglycerol-phosphate dehydratase HisB [Clostridia bacterium]
MRMAKIERSTTETRVLMELNLDGSGKFKGGTGIPFMDHMLQLFTYHGAFNLFVDAQGDLEVDSHHTVEDVGICLGKCIDEALGTREGINRYGAAWIPMDEALAMAVLDISGRPFLSYDVPVTNEKVGTFDVELAEEFFRAVSIHGGLTLHIRLLQGKNSHHIIEAVFKAFGRALKEAAALTGTGIPSTKGLI